MTQQHFTLPQLERLAAAMQQWIAGHPEPDVPAISLGWDSFRSAREIADGVSQAVEARKGGAPGPLASIGEDMIELFEANLPRMSADAIISEFAAPRPERELV